MENLLGLDTETRSMADLRKVGAYVYAEHPTTEVLCFAYALNDAEPTLWRFDETPPDLFGCPDDLADYIESGEPISAWNATFDWKVWNEVLCRRFDWPEIKLSQLRDTMAWAAAASLPQALGNCAKELGLPQDKQKDSRGKYLIQRLCKPHKNRKTGEYEYKFDPELFNELCDYCVQDVVVERELARRLRPLTDYEQRVWEMTQRINQRGVPVDADGVRAIIQVIEREKEYQNRKAARITGGAVPSVTQRQKLVDWIAAQGVTVDSIAAEATEKLLADLDLPEPVREVLHIRQEVSQTSLAKFPKLLEIMSSDGTAKGLLTYHGAATGRDASRGGFNVQNLVRPKLKDIELCHDILTLGDWEIASSIFGDDVLAAASSCVRGAIMAPEGYKLVDADFSSIENRVSAWLADHTEKLDMFAAGLDEYKTFASKQMFRVKYEDVTKDQRQLSKPVVLGCMFGLGAGGLVGYAEAYGVAMTAEEAQIAVDAYREEYRPVQKLWYACGDAALNAVRSPGQVFNAGSKLRFMCKGHFLNLRLPSGRVIRWFEPRIEKKETPWGEMRDVVTTMGINTYTRKWERNVIIGSSFFQSAVQGTARDLLMHGCFNAEERGYPVIMRVHDELCTLVAEDFGSPEELVEIICDAPEWAEGLPLAGEGWEAKRFQK